MFHTPARTLAAGSRGVKAGSTLRRKTALIVVGLALVLGLLSACADSATPAEKDADTLTIAAHNQPLSINPALSSTGTGALFTAFAYESLIFHAEDGSYQPALAASFGYVGNGNKLFEMKLREGVKFSDGTALTADGVVEFIDYFKSAGGPFASTLASLEEVTATGPMTVRIKLAQPNPILPMLFSQDYSSGWVISPKALKNPKSLDGGTYGAGPYMLDPEETVANDHYTYVPNPNYHNPSARNFGKVVVKVITNPTSVLQALKTGQVDVAEGDPSTADAAASAGLEVQSVKSQTYFLGLFDRAGTVVPALGDLRVRQALNYAVDRATITEALAGKYGTATAQIVQEGVDMFDPEAESVYSYDPEKAKALLEEAGYADGFKLPVLSTPGITDLMTQALASDLAKVGVTVDIKSVPAGNYVPEALSGKWAAVSFHFGGGSAGWYQSQLMLSSAGPLNPLHSSDPGLESMLEELGRAPLGSADELARSISTRVVQNAWFVPVMALESTLYSSPSIKDIHMSPLGTSDNMLEWSRS